MNIGSKTMLYGPSGTGKTTSLRTLLETPLQPFALFTDPNFDVISDVLCQGGTPPAKRIHFTNIAPGGVSFDALIRSAQQISTLSHQALTDLKSGDKSNYTQFLKLVTVCANFKCDGCGETFGALDSWGLDRIFVLDGLSGLSVMSRDLTVGSKPTMHPGEWGVAQFNVENLIRKFCTGMAAHFVLLGHVEKEVDEVAGSSKIMASTLGRKLAPKLPQMFNDVVLAVREGQKFSWSTDSLGVDLKPRNLPFASNLPPSFVPLLDSFEKRRATVAPAANGAQSSNQQVTK